MLLPMSSPQAVRRALRLLKAGAVVAFPTDTVYGLGTPTFDGQAVEKIYAIKGRSIEKAIPVLIAGQDDLARVALTVPEMATRLAARWWPGPLTLVIPKHPSIPLSVSAGSTLGVRVPAHAALRELLTLCGPLAVTSANLSGQPSPVTAGEVLDQLGGRIALILDDGVTPGGIPSTVVDCTGSEPRLLREGPITFAQIENSLGPKA